MVLFVCFYIIYSLGDGVHASHGTCMEVEETALGSQPSFHHIGSRDETWVFTLGANRLCPLSHRLSTFNFGLPYL